MGNTYKKGSVKASYAKDEEKKYNDRAIGAGFTQYGFGNANSGGTTNAIYRDWETNRDRKSTRLNSSHITRSRIPSSA